MLLQPQVKYIIVLFQKITIPPPTECSQKCGVGGGLKIKSLKGWGDGRCLSSPPPKKEPSMKGKWTIPVMKYYISDTEK